ncbi:MAG: hypothetical protein PVG66_09905 [Chromatiales bacterium]|jgi:hypothetical protein
MDEYVKVIFPNRRVVRVDGQSAGLTNKTFQVETGQHTFDLGPKQNYKPKQRTVNVVGTMPDAPKIITFELVEDGS